MTRMIIFCLIQLICYGCSKEDLSHQAHDCIEITVNDSLHAVLSGPNAPNGPIYGRVREQLGLTLHLENDCLAIPVQVGEFDTLKYRLIWNEDAENQVALLYLVIENLNTPGVPRPASGLIKYIYFDMSELKRSNIEVDTIRFSHYSQFSADLIY